MIQKAYKFRIYPNKQQRELIDKHFNCVRFIYNWGLEKKIKAYKEENKKLSCFDLINELPNLKKNNQWLKEVNAQSLQMSLRNLDNAFTSFFRKQNKFPIFKSKKNKKQTYQIPQGLRIRDNKLSIPKISHIKVKIDREVEGKIKTSTLSKTLTNKYFISILTEQDKNIDKKPKITNKSTLGIDLGIESFATYSNGIKIQNPKFLKNQLKKLKKEQRRLSRKKKGSNNRKKQRLRVAEVYEKIANSRSDFLHKLTFALTHDNQVNSIAIEDLAVSNLLKNRYLAQSISDVSWYEFRRQLEYKSNWYGKNLLIIGRFQPSSKICSNCGEINSELKLSDRNWKCDNCSTEHDRDINAAKNIKHFALLGKGISEFTLGEKIVSKESSLNQEAH